MKKRSLLLLILCLVMLLAACDTTVPAKEFEEDDFSITLTTKFKKKIAFDMVKKYQYESPDLNVAVLKDSFAGLESPEDMDPETYMELLMEANGWDERVRTKGGLTYIEFETTEDKATTSHRVYAYQGEDAFWAVEFYYVGKISSSMTETIQGYAESVEV